MDKQRLQELAGISSNMSTPSQEPYTEIPTQAEQTADDETMPTDENNKSEIIRLCMCGMEDEQDPKECLAKIFSLLINKETN